MSYSILVDIVIFSEGGDQIKRNLTKKAHNMASEFFTLRTMISWTKTISISKYFVKMVYKT